MNTSRSLEERVRRTCTFRHMSAERLLFVGWPVADWDFCDRFNVVKAYSLYDEEVGYTQGLQFIVGPLLLNVRFLVKQVSLFPSVPDTLSLQMPDEEAFCVLVRLMKSYDLRSHYTPNMPGLQLRLFQFDRLLEELLPGVFMHLLRQGVKSSMYASQWFLTLFGSVYYSRRCFKENTVRMLILIRISFQISIPTRACLLGFRSCIC